METVFLKNERSRIFMQRLIGGRNMVRSTFKAEIVLIIGDIISFVVYYFYEAVGSAYAGVLNRYGKIP